MNPQQSTAPLLLLVFMGSIILSACNNYPEGPALSLRSKKERVANTWKVEYAEDENGKETTADYKSFTLTAEKDPMNWIIQDGSAEFTGTWKFNNDQTMIYSDVKIRQGVYVQDTAEILKLKEKEMWLNHKGGDEVHYVPL